MNKPKLPPWLAVIFLLCPLPGLAAQPSDEFLTGYLTSILERELHWDRSSYRLEVRQGLATLTLKEDDPERRAQLREGLKSVDGLQGLNIVIAEAEPAEGRPIKEKVYETLAVVPERIPFPTGDIFRPLLADPKQPEFFVSLRSYNTQRGSTRAAAVGYGESFGLFRQQGEQPGDGLQLSIAGALFAQFDLDSPSSDLVNADYTIGVPLTYRRGAYSARLRVYHQSSHLGDEFLLREHPERINLSYEAVEALASREWDNWRGYVGGEYLLHREPLDLKRASLHGGIEYYSHTPRLGAGRLVGGLDLKSFQQHDWSVDTSLKVGLEFGPPDPGRRRLRLMAEGFRGHNPHGQFYEERISYYGMGVYFGF